MNKFSSSITAIAMGVSLAFNAMAQEPIKVKGLYLQMPEAKAIEILANEFEVKPADMVKVVLNDAPEKACLFTPGRFTGTYTRHKDTPQEACKASHNEMIVTWLFMTVNELLLDIGEVVKKGALPEYRGQGAPLAQFTNGKLTAVTLTSHTNKILFGYEEDLQFVDFAQAFVNAYSIPDLKVKAKCTYYDGAKQGCWEYRDSENGMLLSILSPGDAWAPIISMSPISTSKKLNF